MLKEKIPLPVLIIAVACLIPSIILALFVSIIAGISFYLGSGVVIVYFQKFFKKLEVKEEEKKKQKKK